MKEGRKFVRNIIMTILDLKISDRAEIVQFNTTEENRYLIKRLMEMGLTLGAIISLEHWAPFGGNLAISCRGALIGLRTQEAQLVQVKKL